MIRISLALVNITINAICVRLWCDDHLCVYEQNLVFARWIVICREHHIWSSYKTHYQCVPSHLIAIQIAFFLIHIFTCGLIKTKTNFHTHDACVEGGWRSVGKLARQWHGWWQGTMISQVYRTIYIYSLIASSLCVLGSCLMPAFASVCRRELASCVDAYSGYCSGIGRTSPTHMWWRKIMTNSCDAFKAKRGT